MLPAITDSEKKPQSREELAPLFLAWLAGATVQYCSKHNEWITLELANYLKIYGQPPALDDTFCAWVKDGYPIRLKPLDE